MTTEPSGDRTNNTERKRGPARTSAFELRLYVVAILAAVYLVAWRTIATPAKSVPIDEPPVPTATALAPAQRAVWLEDLPAAQRPQVAVPAGWHVVSRTTSAPAPRVQLVRVPASRPVRVRTRSS